MRVTVELLFLVIIVRPDKNIKKIKMIFPNTYSDTTILNNTYIEL